MPRRSPSSRPGSRATAPRPATEPPRAYEAHRQAGIPGGVRASEEEGEAVLPLCGDEGLGDGADSRRRRDRDVAAARRRAGPEGGPDLDHLRPPSRVVLLL